MNDQGKYWDKEYDRPQFLALNESPQVDVVKFSQFLKEQNYNLDNKEVLDLGCGIGRHAKYFNDHGADVEAWDISGVALSRARSEFEHGGIHFRLQSAGEKFPLIDNSMDIIIDQMTSISLYQGERESYLKETSRVLKPGGYLFVRTFCLDGDKNARNLIRDYPGPEPGTYIHPNSLIVEKTITEKEFKDWYQQKFEIVDYYKQTGYQRWGTQSYKRRYQVGYLRKLID